MFPSSQQTAALLRHAALEEQRRRDGRALATRRLVENAIRDLAKPPACVWLIGSLAWGGFGERSDVDIVTVGVDAKTSLQIELRIARELGLVTDLLRLEDLPGSFAERVIASGIKVL